MLFHILDQKRPQTHKEEMAGAAKAAAAPPAPAAPAQQAQQFSATNGKWTIGGLNKNDVYKLVLNNGLA